MTRPADRILAIIVLAFAMSSGAASPAQEEDGNSQLVSKVEELLKTGDWCHQAHAPVGFVLNFFHFRDNEFRIVNKYVSDEGTVMREGEFLGSWKATAGSATKDNVVKIHFDFVKATDADLPSPSDLSLRLTGEGKLVYNDGDKFSAISGDTNICY